MLLDRTKQRYQAAHETGTEESVPDIASALVPLLELFQQEQPSKRALETLRCDQWAKICSHNKGGILSKSKRFITIPGFM